MPRVGNDHRRRRELSGAAAPACAELGLRAIVYLEVFGTDPEGALARFDATRTRIEDSLSLRVRLGVSPHAPYTVSADVYRALGGLGLLVVTHLAESADEHDFMVQGRGSDRRYHASDVARPDLRAPSGGERPPRARTSSPH